MIFQRGCTLDTYPDEDCNESDGCKKCQGAACNNENVKYHHCVVCNSDDNSDCGKLEDVAQLKTQCTGDPYAIDKRGCYTIKLGNHKAFNISKD